MNKFCANGSHSWGMEREGMIREKRGWCPGLRCWIYSGSIKIKQASRSSFYLRDGLDSSQLCLASGNEESQNKFHVKKKEMPARQITKCGLNSSSNWVHLVPQDDSGATNIF